MTILNHRKHRYKHRKEGMRSKAQGDKGRS